MPCLALTASQHVASRCLKVVFCLRAVFTRKFCPSIGGKNQVPHAAARQGRSKAVFFKLCYLGVTSTLPRGSTSVNRPTPRQEECTASLGKVEFDTRKNSPARSSQPASVRRDEIVHNRSRVRRMRDLVFTRRTRARSRLRRARRRSPDASRVRAVEPFRGLREELGEPV